VTLTGHSPPVHPLPLVEGPGPGEHLCSPASHRAEARLGRLVAARYGRSPTPSRSANTAVRTSQLSPRP